MIGCQNSDSEEDLTLSGELLTTEKTFPENFYDIAEQGVVAYKTTNQQDFNTQWDDFGLKEVPSEVDWDDKAVIFLGIIESGSCPYEYTSVKLNAEKTEMVFHLDIGSEENACTDDATPRTIVVAVDADEISGVNFVQIDNYNGISPRVELLK